MSKNGWDENEIEKTLSKLPPIKDTQSKDDLFLAIQERAKSDTPKRNSNRKKQTWFYPAMASVAAIFLIILILPSFLNGDNQLSSNEAVENDMQTAEINEAENYEEENTDNANNAVMNEANADSDNNTMNSLNESDDESDHGGFVAPSTVLTAEVIFLEVAGVSLEKIGIKERQVDDGQSFDEAVSKALIESDPTSGQVLSQLQEIRVEVGETNVIILEFSADHGFESLASAEHGHLNMVFEEIFSAYGFDELKLVVDDDQELVYGQSGESGPIDVSSTNRGYYLYGEGVDALFVSGRMAEEELTNELGEPLTFQETIEEMNEINNEDAWYGSVIPPNIEIVDIEVIDNHAQLTLIGASNQENELDELLMQSLLLVAEDFSIETIQIFNEDGIIIGEYQLRSNEFLNRN